MPLPARCEACTALGLHSLARAIYCRSLACCRCYCEHAARYCSSQAGAPALIALHHLQQMTACLRLRAGSLQKSVHIPGQGWLWREASRLQITTPLPHKTNH